MTFNYNKAYARPQAMNLWNVDNTADLDKPITREQESINATQAVINQNQLVVNDTKLDVIDPVATGAMILNSNATFAAELIINCNASQQAKIIIQENNLADPSDGFITLRSRLGAGGSDAPNILQFNHQFAFSDLNNMLLLTLTPINTLDSNPVAFANWNTTNRQINSQPIPQRFDFDGVDTTPIYDCGAIATNCVIDNKTNAISMTIRNPYDGKKVSFLPLDPLTGTVHNITYSGEVIVGPTINVVELVFSTALGYASTWDAELAVEFNIIADVIIDTIQTYLAFPTVASG